MVSYEMRLINVLPARLAGKEREEGKDSAKHREATRRGVYARMHSRVAREVGWLVR